MDNVAKVVVWSGLLWAMVLPVAAAEPPPLIQTRGEAVLEVPADQASVDLGVVSSGRDADRTLASNSRTLQALLKALDQAGVPEAALSTRAFVVRPQWSPRPRDADAAWQPQIIGYQVRHQVRLVTQQLAALPRWLQLAAEAGANDIGQLQFSLAEEQQLYRQALQQATRDALAQAQALAAAAGVEGLALYQLQVDSQRPQPLAAARLETMALRAAAPPPPLQAGDIQVRATVTARYRFTP